MTHKYVILDLNAMTYMKDDEGNVKFYDNFDHAYRESQKYEIQDAMIPFRVNG
jgi:hypothetical protein